MSTLSITDTRYADTGTSTAIQQFQKKQGYTDTTSIYISKNINYQIILENEIDNKYYVSKGLA